jgi:hypothetical protein
MFTGWVDLARSLFGRNKSEFVSVDARVELKQESRSYEMLSHEFSKTGSVLSAVSPVKSPGSSRDGRQTPDYFTAAPRYQTPDPYGPASSRYAPHQRSFSSPRAPRQVDWDADSSFAASSPPPRVDDMNPLGMNRL